MANYDLKMDIQKTQDGTVVRAAVGNVLRANDDGSIRFRLISKTVDRYGTVFLPMGADLRNYKTNPVWLWVHNLERGMMGGGTIRPPIGKANTRTIDQNEKALDLDILFDEDNDPFAAMVAAKHRDGFLNAASLGARIIEASDDTVLKDQKGPTFKVYELIEGSSVPIPGNPKALQQREWGEYLDELKGFGIEAKNLEGTMKFMGWDEYEIRDAMPNESTPFTVADLQKARSVMGFDYKTSATGTYPHVTDGNIDFIPPGESRNIDDLLFEDRAAVPYKKFPLAPEETKWSFSASDGNAILGDPPNWTRYKSVHSWWDPEEPKARGSYKLPMAKMTDGTIKAVWRGVAAAMAALLGARGGVNIPANDKKAVYNRLARYYKDFDKKPPEFRMLEEDEERLILGLMKVESVEVELFMEHRQLVSEWGDTVEALLGHAEYIPSEDPLIPKKSRVFDRATAIPELRQNVIFLCERLLEENGELSETERKLLEEALDHMNELLITDRKDGELQTKLNEIKEVLEAQKQDKKDKQLIQALTDILKE